MTPFLVGDRVVLAPLDRPHLDGPYISWLNDPEVCRFNGHHVIPYTRARAEAYLEDVAASGDVVLAVHLAADGRHIGNVSLQSIDERARSAEFAILMGDRSAWGSGYATEAAAALVAHGFAELGLHRVWAGTLAANEGMRKLAARLGMREEACLREAAFKHGAFHDIIMFGVLAEEWSPPER